MTLSVFRAAGASVIVSFPDEGLPEVLHWGSDVGAPSSEDLRALADAQVRQVPSSALDEPWSLTILPTETEGWQGRPALSGARAGMPLLPQWRTTDVQRSDDGFSSEAQAEGLVLHTELRLDAAGVLRISHRLRNTGGAPLELSALESTLPVPARADEILDFTGRWTRERAPQRRPVSMGTQVRESRRGRTGHDSPLLTILGEPGFGDAHGEVWGVHLAWSGDAVYRVDRLPEGRVVLGAGELLRPGEIVLAPGEQFTAPETVFVWSETGLDGLSQRLHDSLRARPAHPRGPRPVVLNTWEAVYFAQDLGALTALADAAAEIGVERFVLDDGWFRGRRSDRAGLGDWYVDEEVWPEGLHALTRHVTGRGMGFGLWVEPEMVNGDSELARAHPDWILAPAHRTIRSWRHQQVLDLARPEVSAWLIERLSALLAEYPIEYLKWDQNRDLLEAVHAGRAGVDAHTRAVYALLDELRRRHPGVEIESCASGGARIDLGILAHTDRVWASDTNDPVERARIQRWTELLLPPELIGSHVGPATAHTTARTTDLRFRMAMTMFGSAGIEWDLTSCSPDERSQLAEWIALYKRLRSLVHSGTLLHADAADEGTMLTGSISSTGDHALYRLVRTQTGPWAVPPAIRLPGLDRERRYRVRVVRELSSARYLDTAPPPWIVRGEVTVSGALLSEVGLRTPLLPPASALMLEVTADDPGSDRDA